MKRIIALLLICCMLLGLLAITAVAESITISTANVSNGLLNVIFTGSINGTARIKIEKGSETVFSASKEFDGKSFTYGLPVHQLPYGEYQVTVSCENAESRIFDSRTITAVFGSQTDTIGGGETSVNALHASRAIMLPYATVYSDPSMGSKVAHLKKYDYVHVLSDNGTVAKISYRIQSGNGTTTKTDQIHAIYLSDDDILGVGYVYSAAFQSPSLGGAVEDIQRDVVELAYSRLGTKGVYNQGLRLTDCYVDCSALASYCWYQLGYDFSDGGGTACNGIVTWARNHHAVLWEAGTQADIAGQMLTAEQESGSEESFDSELTEYSAEDFVVYTRTFDPYDFNVLEPGDLIFLSYPTEVQSDDGTTFLTRTKNNYDHVMIFVGCKTNSAGDVISVQCIESSNADINTHVSTYAPSDLVKNLSMIVRPTGCETLNTGIIHNIPLGADGWVCPLTSYVITSEFGTRIHPITQAQSFHNGIDMSAPAGTEIYAAYDGVVTTAGWSNAYGNYVIITHADGYTTLYGHMTSYAVQNGDGVQAGEVIGYVGSTGWSTGPHLHFTIYLNGTAIDPRTILDSLN